jgi:hypothetical protein
MSYTEIISQLMVIIGILVIFVNIFTEVVKKIWNFKSTQELNVFVTILSIIITAAVFLAYWQINEMTITWYVFAAFLVVGMMVAYAAMFGFDKLLKYFE